MNTNDNIVFNAENMKKVADSASKEEKPVITSAKKIMTRIQVAARTGHYDAAFLSKEDIDYIKENKEDIENCGFNVVLDSFYSIPRALISWK